MSMGELFNSTLASVTKFWHDLDIKTRIQDVAGSSSEMVDISLAFGIAFGIGFFFKRHFRFLFVLLLACFLIVKVAEYNAFMTVHWDLVNDALGFGPAFHFNALAGHAVEWIKQNLMLFVPSVLGFFIGYKLG